MKSPTMETEFAEMMVTPRLRRRTLARLGYSAGSSTNADVEVCTRLEAAACLLAAGPASPSEVLL